MNNVYIKYSLVKKALKGELPLAALGLKTRKWVIGFFSIQFYFPIYEIWKLRQNPHQNISLSKMISEQAIFMAFVEGQATKNTKVFNSFLSFVFIEISKLLQGFKYFSFSDFIFMSM